MAHKTKMLGAYAPSIFVLCAGRDSNPRRHKPIGLQPIAIDHSATDAVKISIAYICIISKLVQVCLVSLF